MAFDRRDDGELGPAFEPREMPDEARAVRLARELATYHVGLIAGVRNVMPDLGEFSEPTVLFQHGDIPGMD